VPETFRSTDEGKGVKDDEGVWERERIFGASRRVRERENDDAAGFS